MLLPGVVLIAIPVLVFCTEVVAAFFYRNGRNEFERQVRPRVAVLVPAHNESAGLAHTIATVQLQLIERDRLVVVADNCTDNTAEIARSLGVEVLERADLIQIGKGFALDFGIRYLAAKPPEVVIVLDADCRFGEGSVDVLAKKAITDRKPVQALNLMRAPGGAAGLELAEFAWRVKNWVRPLGLKVLGLPCQLMGTGMAFPWDLIQNATLATASVVEDLKLGIELAEKGRGALFCPEATVVSYFPTSEQGIETQRQRWQGGHLSMLAAEAPKTLLRAIKTGDLRLAALALDLSVPPIILLIAAQILSFSVCLLAFVFYEAAESFYVAASSFSLLAATLFCCWVKFGSDIVPPSQLLLAPVVAARRLSFYHRMIKSGTLPQKWVRTDRTGSTRR